MQPECATGPFVRALTWRRASQARRQESVRRLDERNGAQPLRTRASVYVGTFTRSQNRDHVRVVVVDLATRDRSVELIADGPILRLERVANPRCQARQRRRST